MRKGDCRRWVHYAKNAKIGDKITIKLGNLWQMGSKRRNEEKPSTCSDESNTIIVWICG
jgi:hypothetical protein